MRWWHSRGRLHLWEEGVERSRSLSGGGGGRRGLGKGGSKREDTKKQKTKNKTMKERRYTSRRAAAESSEDQGNPIIPSQRWGKGNTNLSQLYLILASQRSCQGGASSPILHRKQVQFRTFPRRQSWCKAELGFRLCLTTLFPLCQELPPAP